MLINNSNDKFSEPRFLLLGGNGGKWNALDRPNGINECNGIEAWCYAFKGDYRNTLDAKPGDIKNYDIVMVNLNYLSKARQFEHILRLTESRSSDTKWIAMIEGSATDYLKPNRQLSELFSMCDLVNVINEPSLPYFKTITDTRAEFIGIPYPVDSVAGYKTPVEKRKRKAFMSAFLLSRYCDYLVVKNSGLDYFGFEYRIKRTLKRLKYNLSTYGSLKKYNQLEKAGRIYNDSKLKIFSDMFFADYLGTISDSYIAVNLDFRYTWSRFVIDSAVLGIPMITTKSTGHGQLFYPETTIDNEFQISRAIELRDMLLNDFDFYRRVAEYPADKLDWLKHQNMKEKLMNSLTT